MTVGTRVDSTVGPNVTSNGTGFQVERSTNNKGFGPYRVDSVKSFVSTSAAGNSPTAVAGDAGVCTMSGSGAVLTVTLPTAANSVGAKFIFRNIDARAHIVTSSQETAGVTVFVSGVTVGAKLTMAATVGASAILQCDGVHFVVVGGFGGNSVS